MSVLWKSIMTVELSWSVLMSILFTLKRFDLINPRMLCACIKKIMWNNTLLIYLFFLLSNVHVLLFITCFFIQNFMQFVLTPHPWKHPWKKWFFYACLKVEEIRKVVDSELGFVADVPYRGSGAKVGVDYSVCVLFMARRTQYIHFILWIRFYFTSL